MKLTLDIKDGNRIRETPEQTEYERIATVSGLTFTDARALRQALECPGLPRLYEPHPAHPSARCIARNAESVGDKSARIQLTYQTPGPKAPKGESQQVSIEVGSSVEEEEVDTDVKGNLLLVEYTDARGAVHKDYVTATLGRPMSCLVVRRQEPVSPGAKSRRYTGKVNAGAWQGGAARTWRCDGITGASADGGKTYDVTYAFTYKERTWDKIVKYLDPETGRAPVTPPVVKGKGIRTYQLYETANFAGLNLPI